jgi:hypothetical protein
MVMSIACKDCECDIDYCCCDEACPVCGEAPTHCDGLAAFAAEFGIIPLPSIRSEVRRPPFVEQFRSAKGKRQCFSAPASSTV